MHSSRCQDNLETSSARHPSRMTGRRLASWHLSRRSRPPGRPLHCIQAAGGTGAGSNTRVAPLLAKVVTADSQQRIPASGEAWMGVSGDDMASLERNS
jgi:hypothetical protein